MANVPNQNDPPFIVKKVNTSISFAPVDNVGANPSENFAFVKVAVLLPTASCLTMIVADCDIPALGGFVNVKAQLAFNVMSNILLTVRFKSCVPVLTAVVVTVSL